MPENLGTHGHFTVPTGFSSSGQLAFSRFARLAVTRKSNDTLVQDLNFARLAIDTQLRERFMRSSRQFDEEILHDMYT